MERHVIRMITSTGKKEFIWKTAEIIETILRDCYLFLWMSQNTIMIDPFQADFPCLLFRCFVDAVNPFIGKFPDPEKYLDSEDDLAYIGSF